MIFSHDRGDAEKNAENHWEKGSEFQRHFGLGAKVRIAFVAGGGAFGLVAVRDRRPMV